MRFRCHRGILSGLILFLILAVSYNTPYAQDTQAKYQRKSISYVDAVLKLGGAQLNADQDAFLLNAINNEMSMSRFDYNPLPDAILADFKQQILARGVTDLDALAQMMNEVLAPEIMRFVDLEKEMRAQNLVSEVERNSFIVKKAKESGITAEDLKAIMNSAYIYMPVLSEAKKYESASANTVNYDLKGGILWFSIKTDTIGSSVQLLAKKDAAGSGFAKLSATNIRYAGKSLSGEEYAFYTAAEALAKNLKVATQEIQEFRLTNPITNTGAGWVEFGMGKKEGLGVDDKYIVAEFIEKPDGSMLQKKLGMVRISRVADNRDKPANSRARVLIGGRYERGQLALEHPRLPIDLSFRLVYLPFTVKNATYESNGQTLNWFDDDIKTNFYGGQLWFNYNLARSTNISQFYFALFGEAGYGQLKGWKMYGEDVPGGLNWGVGGGLVKKFYANRFHLGLEALGEYTAYSFSGSGMDNGTSHDYSWSIDNFIMVFNANMEIALSYDLNLGVGAGYRLAGETKSWTYKSDGAEQDVSNWDLPKAQFGGLGFQVYLTWSLPSLSYDPLKMARGAMGN
ncbi:MAG: hypothetical protein NTW14_10955 [bacterium]|nr:hypothetical protein [bacterium]